MLRRCRRGSYQISHCEKFDRARALRAAVGGRAERKNEECRMQNEVAGSRGADRELSRLPLASGHRRLLCRLAPPGESPGGSGSEPKANNHRYLGLIRRALWVFSKKSLDYSIELWE